MVEGIDQGKLAANSLGWPHCYFSMYNTLMIQQILLGLIAVVLGVVGMKYNFKLVGITGNVGFAERYLGAGGTYALYKIIAIVLIIGGLLFMTGLGEPVLEWLLSPIAGFFPEPLPSQ